MDLPSFDIHTHCNTGNYNLYSYNHASEKDFYRNVAVLNSVSIGIFYHCLLKVVLKRPIGLKTCKKRTRHEKEIIAILSFLMSIGET